MRIELEIPEAILEQLLGGVTLPDMACVRYAIPTPPALGDVDSALREAIGQGNLAPVIRPGMTVAIGVGSRGIGRLPEIVKTLVSVLKELGAKPFIVPAMGSHGGATAEGQRQVLAHLGITEEAVEAPVRSSMETAIIGTTEDATPVRLDRLALDADGIAVVARIKPHTAFRGPYESGMAKMIAIGLGKQAGAAQTHARGFGMMAEMVPAMARVALANAPILFALAVLENAYDLPFKIVAVPASKILQREPGLLEEARVAMPRLPFDDIDVLVIDRIGKNISGDGADPNITGRYPTPFASGGPTVNKQVVLDLTEETAGNANGIGTADFTTIRAARKVDLAMTYPNSLTSTVPGPVKLPMILPSDRLAVAAAVLTCHAVGREPRVVRIRDTLHLDELRISAALVDEAMANSQLRIEDALRTPEFDEQGNYPEL